MKCAIIPCVGYELVDHTADLGIRVWADDIRGLFEEAAKALFDIITDLTKVEAHLKREIVVRGSSREELMVAWLNELLYLHEVERLIFCNFSITKIDEGTVTGVSTGEEFDEARHSIKTEVKAVTYHQLEIKEQGGRWQAQVIFDI
jgi:SHS2 domain-containing protein